MTAPDREALAAALRAGYVAWVKAQQWPAPPLPDPHAALFDAQADALLSGPLAQPPAPSRDVGTPGPRVLLPEPVWRRAREAARPTKHAKDWSAVLAAATSAYSDGRAAGRADERAGWATVRSTALTIGAEMVREKWGDDVPDWLADRMTRWAMRLRDICDGAG